MNMPNRPTIYSLHYRFAGLCLALAALICFGEGANAQIINPGPTFSVSGGIMPDGQPQQQGLFTWETLPHIAGVHFSPGAAYQIVLYGPINSLGVTPTDHLLGILTADGTGNLNGDVLITYPSQVGYNGNDLPYIQRPGLYEVHAVGPTDVTAENDINLCPDTIPSPTLPFLNWPRSRGARDGWLDDSPPERTDPEWVGVWDNKPVEMYGIVAQTDLTGSNQPCVIADNDYPSYHYGHDADLLVVPDERYRWLLGTANFTEVDHGRDRGRVEVEWETQNNGRPELGSYGTGHIGLPLWAMPTVGDSIYTLGHWVLDNGHPQNGDRTEIHPPRLLATTRTRNTVAPLSPSSSCMTRALQVDIYVSGHGGGANQYYDALEDLLDNHGVGGGRIEDYMPNLQGNSLVYDTYYAFGPDPGSVLEDLIRAKCGIPGVSCDIGTTDTVAGPSGIATENSTGLPTVWDHSMPPTNTITPWTQRIDEERPINDMDYDFDVRLPAPPGGATSVRVQVITHGEHTTGVNEAITYTNPDQATGLPTMAHIHLPYNGADSGIYARTLKFYWDKYNPPGRHFVVKMNDIFVNYTDEQGCFGGSDGEWFLWADICGQWIFLTELDPHGHGENDGFLEVGAGDTDTLLDGATFDVYLDPADKFRVFTTGYERNDIDSIFGVDIGHNAYDVGHDLVEKGVGTCLFNASDGGEDFSLGGAVFQSLSFPAATVVGPHSVPSDPVDLGHGLIGSTLYEDFTVTYITAPPRAELNGVPADFGPVCLGSSEDRVIQVFNLGEDPLDVTRITVSGAGFSRLPTPNVPFTVAVGEEVDITVRFSPTDVHQGVGTIIIEGTDPCQPSLSFPLNGSVVHSTISASPASTIFGATAVGCTAAQVVTIINTGPCDLTVNGVTMEGTGYTVGPVSLPFSLAPGASTTLTVTFAPPSVARAFRGTLTLASNDPAHPTTALTFCGEGVRTGARVLVLQKNGTPYAIVDQITLASYGVKPATNVSLKNVPLTVFNPTTSCQTIRYDYEAALPATTTTGQRGSYYNVRVKVGNKAQSVSFTLGTCDFKQITITLQ